MSLSIIEPLLDAHRTRLHSTKYLHSSWISGSKVRGSKANFSRGPQGTLRAKPLRKRWWYGAFLVLHLRLLQQRLWAQVVARIRDSEHHILWLTLRGWGGRAGPLPRYEGEEGHDGVAGLPPCHQCAQVQRVREHIEVNQLWEQYQQWLEGITQFERLVEVIYSVTIRVIISVRSRIIFQGIKLIIYSPKKKLIIVVT